MKKTRKKYRTLSAVSIFTLIAPTLTIGIINFNDYFSVQKGVFLPQYLEVASGFILLAGSGVLLVLKKTQFLKGSRGLIVGLILSILLKSIINDIVLILSSLTIGSIVYSVFQPKINELKQVYQYEKQAEIQATAHKNIVINYQEKKEVELDGSV